MLCIALYSSGEVEQIYQHAFAKVYFLRFAKATKQILNDTGRLTGKQPERNYLKIMEFYKIKPTKVRIAVLKAIYTAWWSLM